MSEGLSGASPGQDDEARFLTLFEQSPISTQLFAPTGETLRVNRAWERLWGVPAQGAAGYNILQDGQLADRGVRPYVERAFAGEPTAIPTFKYEPDQSLSGGAAPYRWVRGTIFPIKDAAGCVLEVVFQQEDVTDQVEAAAELEAERNRLVALVQRMPLGIVIAEAPSGRLVLGNQQAERILRQPLAQVTSIAEYARYRGFDLDGRPLAPEEWPLSRALSTGEVVTNEPIDIIRGDGSRGTISVSAAPIHDGAGEITGGIATFTDITRRRETERELRARVRQQAIVATLGQRALATDDLPSFLDEAARLVAATLQVELVEILELLPDGRGLLLRAGLGWRANYVGVATVGAQTGSQAGYTLASTGPVIVDDLAAERRFQVPALLREHGAVSGITVIIAGPHRPYGVLGAHTTARRHFSPDDSHFLQGIANVLAAAIERRRTDLEREELLERERTARAAAEDAIRLRDQFLSIAAHELRTPVTTIKGYAQLLLRWQERGQLDPGRLPRYLRTLDQVTSQLDALTNDLLDVSRLRMGYLQLRSRPLDLVALVRAVVERFADHLDDRHTLVVETTATEYTISGDDARLTQVLLNLLENAAKYSPDGGPIEVRVAPVGAGVAVTVRDQGIGLPADAAEVIFEPFGRAANAANRHLPGLGLGLYISRDIATHHGGCLDASSPGEGLGSTFTLWLPRAPAAVES